MHQLPAVETNQPISVIYGFQQPKLDPSTKRRIMTDKTIKLDQNRGMTAQRQIMKGISYVLFQEIVLGI